MLIANSWANSWANNRIVLTACGVLATLLLAGCAAKGIPEGALRLQESSLETRNIQTRTFSAASEMEILAASIAVLQDMEYGIDEIERPLGVLTASKLVDADSSSQKTGLFFLDLLCAIGGSGDCDSSTHADDSQKIMLTMVVMPSLANENEFVTRVTLQRVVFDKESRVNLREKIVDPEIYQQIFENLSKSIFLQANQ
ncbi:MAG: hypothetical protein O7D88_06465 [Gammaproteobacteria bacterium]|nr:hypothetical protein [Gammaproteobacteria bacterium]